jgi:3-hydroxyisobutyrate dehydrogenase
MNEHVGFVGLGSQGAPIAMRILQGGHPLTVWARRPEVLMPFEEAGARSASSLAELGSACPLVAICVTTDDDVREIALGPDGLLAAMASGSSLAVHSTVHPQTVRAVADEGTSRRVAVIDAPVSGGHAGAVAGTMAVLLGGEREVIDRWRPVLATFATSVEVLGGIGAGQLAKLVNNALAAANLGTALRAVAAARELGLDPDAVFRIMTASSGDSFMLRTTPHMERDGVGLAAARLRKDLNLLHELENTGTTNTAALVSAADVAVTHLEQLAGVDPQR